MVDTASAFTYDLEVFYSPEDEGYIANCKALSFCSAFGETREEAIAEINVAVEGWLEADRLRKENC